MSLLLDTHFLVWILLESVRIREFPWLGQYLPWGVSPVALLEIQFLSEIGKLRVRNPEFVNALSEDSRFVMDDVPLLSLVRQSLALSWTRDPFDRMLCAHSAARRVPLASVDKAIRQHHVLIPRELR